MPAHANPRAVVWRPGSRAATRVPPVGRIAGSLKLKGGVIRGSDRSAESASARRLWKRVDTLGALVDRMESFDRQGIAQNQ